MTHPDSTAAFEADAARHDSDDVAAMRKRLAELEAKQDHQEPEVEVLDPVGSEPSQELSHVHTAEVAGDTWHFHAPKTMALMAFGLGTANRRKGDLLMRTMSQFLQFHLLEDDFDKLMERMSDPADSFGDEDFGDLLNAVVDSAEGTPESKAPKNGPRR